MFTAWGMMQAEAVMRAALAARWLATTPAARVRTRAGDPAALISGLQLGDSNGGPHANAAAPASAHEVAPAAG